MADIFDQVAQPSGDIFDHVAASVPGMEKLGGTPPGVGKPQLPPELSGPPSKPSLMGEMGATSSIVGEAGRQLLTGAGRGAASTLLGADSAIRKVPVVGRMYSAATPPPPSPADVQNLTQPQTPLESAGKTAEQIGEYLVPGGIVADAGRGVDAAVQGMKYAPALRTAGKAALNALSAGAVADAQSGGDTSAALKAAGTAGLVSGAVGALGEAAPVLKDSAQKSYARVLGAAPKEDKMLAETKVAPGLVQRGMMGVTRKGMLGKINATVDDLGKQIGDAVDNLPPNASLPEGDVIQAIDQAAQRHFQVANPSGGTITPSPEAARSLNAVDALKRIVQAGRTLDANGNPVIDTRYLRNLRQNWDALVNKSKGFTTNDLLNNAKLAAYRAASGAVRDQFAQAYPDIDAINKEYSFWKNAQKVLGNTVTRTQSQSTPLGEQIATATGGGVGLSHGLVPGALYAASARMLLKFMRSPAWGTTSAVAKDRIANYMMQGNWNGVNAALSQLGGAAAGPPPLDTPQQGVGQ